jgi:type IV secretory pathway VirB4 component
MSISSQDFVPIKEVRDGVVILKDGTLVSVIMTSSVNFALKSREEQEAIIFQFQNFLNAINFSIQIFSQSRKLDIKPYMGLLSNVLKEQKNELLKIQTREYMEFIKSFTETVNIMTKSFFIAVPYTPSIIQSQGGVLGKLFGNKKGSEQKRENENFEENRVQLEQRVEVVIQGLTRLGVRSVPLGTEELVELYYKLFNPGDTEKPINVTQVTR